MRRDKILALMDRLDSKYSTLKKESQDTSKSKEEIDAVTSQLKDHEADLMPTYMQIAHLYADLHE